MWVALFLETTSFNQFSFELLDVPIVLKPYNVIKPGNVAERNGKLKLILWTISQKIWVYYHFRVVILYYNSSLSPYGKNKVSKSLGWNKIWSCCWVYSYVFVFKNQTPELSMCAYSLSTKYKLPATDKCEENTHLICPNGYVTQATIY